MKIELENAWGILEVVRQKKHLAGNEDMTLKAMATSLGTAIPLTIREARQLADELNRVADEAEKDKL